MANILAYGDKIVGGNSEEDQYVSKSGDIMTGELQIKRDGEVGVRVVRNNNTTTIAKSSIGAGNNIADGTIGSAYGSLFLYGNGTKYGELQARNVTSNRTLQFPDKSGTLALFSDISFALLTSINWYYTEKSFSVDSYSAIILYGARAGKGMFIIFAPNTSEWCEIKNDFGSTITYTKNGNNNYTVTIGAASSSVGSACNLYVLGVPTTAS